ncbi:Vms1/Ankzf1 family peptidyl-tRNA hydrolase [Solwaraspora sp. WMMD1047]|uniref:baeRF2 domain-containing protein n=1 Tax=Solwaraspora sp. WMMD1047 TaxID=3016102 RepID=UPI0024159EF8|nr:Vms1/Ankzf1 family peptidyl-tRNA hydrolase [Solwaraspora sp. WMMD1047]MDG4828305.1 Vms1/Ankzf1 family peptidyl-tRNA hydrolase [Solwaraspora sp. WMMD1047]
MNVAFLRPLFDQPGPWVSVYLDASRDGANADHEVGLRWRALRSDLAGQGADPATLDALDQAVRDQPARPGRHGLVLLARAGRVALAEPLPAPPPSDEARLGPLPHVMPLLAHRGEEVTHVRVLADRTGGDLDGITADEVPRQRTVDGGETFPLRKVQAGGWSHRRYQQAAEVSWERNAGDVAAATVDLAESIGAEVIVVGGDVRAAQLFTQRLPARWRERTVRTDLGSRHAGADNTALDDATGRAIAEVTGRHTREVIDRYQAQAGEGTAPTGLAEVVAALQRGQVDTVLLVNDNSSTDTLWVGPDDPTHLAVDEESLTALGVRDPQRVRADAALLRAIAGTDAQLVLVEPDDAPLEHGIGAVLRYADATTS